MRPEFAKRLDMLVQLDRSTSGLSKMTGFGALLFVAALPVSFERMYQNTQQPGDVHPMSERRTILPNYDHVWFAHDPIFRNNAYGSLSGFGHDYKEANGNWQKLCRLDSDGDGLTNGEELGDPCCMWETSKQLRFTEASREYRRWHITHPGREESPPGGTRQDWSSDDREEFRKRYSPESCDARNISKYEEDFRQFYFQNADGEFEAKPLHLAKLACLAIYIWTMYAWAKGGLVHDVLPFNFPQPALRPSTSVAMCLFAFIYADMTSGIIHLVLDYAPHWLPGVGAIARGFQYHHWDPTGITRISWYEYASHIHFLIPLIVAVCHVSKASRVQRVFWFWCGIFAHLFQSTHRWSHFPPEVLPSWVKAGQRLGIFMPHEYHMRHHADLEHQFSCLAGMTDFLLDGLSRIIPPYRYDIYVFVGIVWFLLPVFADLAYRRYVEPLDEPTLQSEKTAVE